MRSLRGVTVVVLILMVFALAFAAVGCAPNPSQFNKKLDPKTAGWWDKYLVIPLSQMLDWFKDVLGNYGLSILIVTFLVRLVLLPLTWKQQQSARAMQELQPHIAKIREKYKKEPQRVQKETMKLFQEKNVNPMAGCLPLIVQIPIMLAFYQAIMYNSHIAHSSFLYMQLGKPDPYFILPLLAAITTYLQLIVTGASSNPQMKIFLWITPVMIFVIGNQLPTALSLYWFYANVFTILQYALIFKPANEKAAQKSAAR